MSTPAEPSSDAAACEQGRALLREGKVAEGIAVLRGISARVPKVLGDVAWAYRMRNDNDAAMAALREYVAAFPDDFGAWALMARIERERNDPGAAARYARRAVEANPTDEEMWFHLGEILFLQADYRGAAEAYERCVHLSPQNTHAELRRQHALRILGRGRWHAVTRWAAVRSLVRRLLASRLMGDLIELDVNIARDDPRWQIPLQWPEADIAAEPVPPGQEPANFASHFEQCRCPFWQWYLAQPVGGRVRTVLEIGSGSGHEAHHFAFRGAEVVSVVPDVATRLDRTQREIPVIGVDPHLVPRPGNSFDLVVAPYALHRSRAALLALSEWKRLLRPDGHLAILAHLALDGPAPATLLDEQPRHARTHFTFGVPGHVMTLTYWQLRWLFRQAGFFLVGETLLDPERDGLESVKHVDGRRHPDPSRVWDALFLLRKPGRLPCDRALEKPRLPYYAQPA